MALDGSPDPAARRRRRVFYRWLPAYPLAALALTVYYVATSAKSDVGEFLMLLVVGAGTVLAIALLALIDGARRRAIGPALGGCFLGVVPAFLVSVLVFQADRARFEYEMDLQRKRMAALIDASARGDGDGTRAAMAALDSEYSPGHALCLVGGAGLSRDWVLPEPAGSGARVSSERLLRAAETLMRGRPRAQQQALLGALLVRLSERRDSGAHLPAWLRLWRGTQADAATRALAFAQPRDERAVGECHLDGDADLARIVADTWHDDGLRAWIAAGYGFSPEQAWFALDGLRAKAGLDALVAAGFDVGAALRQPGPGGEAMYRFAAQLPSRLDESADPAALADLADAYLRAGAELGRTSYGQTPCETFIEAENARAIDRIAAPAAAREAAARRIGQALCPGGRPPAPAAAATGDQQDGPEAAAQAAQQAAETDGAGERPAR